MVFVTNRGRLPVKGELPESNLTAEFGTLRRAFQVILQATDAQKWEAIAEKRRQDLLVYLALAQFSHRPKLGDLTAVVQEDIKALFGTYKQAGAIADQMLFSLGNPAIIVNCCQNSSVGKKHTHSLMIHVSALEALAPLLRLYEGCASRTIGRLEGASVIKFHTNSPKISYLFYPDFDIDPHPVLHTSMQIDLRDLHVSYRDYDIDDDPPVLHQKDTLVTPDYPLYEKFAKLSRQESDWGLLDDFRAISIGKVGLDAWKTTVPHSKGIEWSGGRMLILTDLNCCALLFGHVKRNAIPMTRILAKPHLLLIDAQICLEDAIHCSSPFLVGCPMVVNVQISRLCWGP